MLNENLLLYGTKTYHQQFSEVCDPLKQYLTINNATYLNINKDGELIYLHSDCAWMQSYIKGMHYKQDLHLVHPDNIGEGFCLLLIQDNYTYLPYNEVMLYEDQNKFDHGFSYIIKTDADFTAFCFTADNGPKIINTLLNQSNIIKNFIQKLHLEVITSFKTLPENKSDLAALKGNLFFQQQGIIPCT